MAELLPTQPRCTNITGYYRLVNCPGRGMNVQSYHRPCRGCLLPVAGNFHRLLPTCARMYGAREFTNYHRSESGLSTAAYCRAANSYRQSYQSARFTENYY